MPDGRSLTAVYGGATPRWFERAREVAGIIDPSVRHAFIVHGPEGRGRLFRSSPEVLLWLVEGRVVGVRHTFTVPTSDRTSLIRSTSEVLFGDWQWFVIDSGASDRSLTWGSFSVTADSGRSHASLDLKTGHPTRTEIRTDLALAINRRRWWNITSMRLPVFPLLVNHPGTPMPPSQVGGLYMGESRVDQLREGAMACAYGELGLLDSEGRAIAEGVRVTVDDAALRELVLSSTVPVLNGVRVRLGARSHAVFQNESNWSGDEYDPPMTIWGELAFRGDSLLVRYDFEAFGANGCRGGGGARLVRRP
jgi:hypothetical protein